ncbi:unnamed protein product [Rotaria socialis]|uniref:Uncharacterized protein n=1 Tax=Rotaria socialis TaxID=392032 RepID=A0A820XRR7_9BILA|nr:unnamed protein product [Rotaria socialis]CAF4538759.1 unnamed protein product [Rotaria socialis]
MLNSPLRQQAMTENVKPTNQHLLYQIKRKRQYIKHSFFNSHSDEEDRASSNDSERHSPYPSRQNRPPVVPYKDLPTSKRPTIATTDGQPHESYQTRSKRVKQDSSDTNSKKRFDSTNSLEYQPGISFDPFIRDDIVKKMSIFLSFYGNFVIIPAIRETLNKIKTMDPDAKLNYWPDIMNFIDSYDLPYADEQGKKLVNELVGKITDYVEQEGILVQDWQKILCTLPDDVTSKFDYRLDRATVDEIKRLGNEDQLPFDLSKPILSLLNAAEKHAGKYIRDSTG